MKTYVALAYRHGWLNHENHLVAAGPDRDAVVQAAMKECEEYAGKYGVVVYEVPESSGSDRQIVAYFASAYGEKGPCINVMSVIAKSIGIAVVSAIERGKALVPKEGSPRLMELVQVEVPDWLKTEYKRVAHREKMFYKTAENESADAMKNIQGGLH